jgi:hypothetical protein
MVKMSGTIESLEALFSNWTQLVIYPVGSTVFWLLFILQGFTAATVANSLCLSLLMGFPLVWLKTLSKPLLLILFALVRMSFTSTLRI